MRNNKFSISIISSCIWKIFIVIILIFVPCFVKADTIKQTQMTSELSDSMFESGEFLFQNTYHTNWVAPFSWGRIKPDQFVHNRFCEFFSSGVESVSFAHLSGETQLNKCNNQCPATAKQQNIKVGESDSKDYHFLYYTIPMWLVALFFKVSYKYKV